MQEHSSDSNQAIDPVGQVDNIQAQDPFGQAENSQGQDPFEQVIKYNCTIS